MRFNKKAKQGFERSGRRAERLAALYLRLKGYRILEMRFKTKLGEIDIIARRGDILIAVEVKRRPTLEIARESISWDTERRISEAIDIYLSKTPSARECGIRFDAIYVTGTSMMSWRLHHIVDAWRA